MPVYKNRLVIGLACGLNAFLNLEVGLTRGEAPDLERKLWQSHARLKEQNRQLEQMRKQLSVGGRRLQPPPLRSADVRRQADPSGWSNGATRKEPGWHRKAIGGQWDEIGQLQFDFLKERGLQANHRFLDVGCGSLRDGIRFIPYLEPGHYYGVDRSEELLEAGRTELRAANLQDRRPNLATMEDFGFERLGQTFDYALAQSVFTHLPLNSIARCLANIDRVLHSDGTFFATYFENRGGKQHLGPLPQGDGVVSYYDRDPFHYTLDAFSWACEGTGLEVEYIGDWEHPRNQYMLAFRKSA